MCQGWSNIKEEDDDDNQFISANYFHHLRRDSISERKNIILISTGSELIMVNKMYFFKYADLTTICKAEKLVSILLSILYLILI